MDSPNRSLGDKLQLLALCHPRAMRLIERVVDRLLNDRKTDTNQT